VTEAAAPLETVVLTEEEVVTRGGPATISWLVPQHDGYVRPQRHPSARAEQLERGSGVVWRTRITLELPRGAELTRIVVRPGRERRSALEHLTGGGRGPGRTTLRLRFRVGKGGALVEVPAPPPQRPK
jgi:hypothetical protein